LERLASPPRKDWQARLESVGFHFHSLEGAYWDESACYRFSAAEIDMLEEVTADVHEMSLAAVQSIVERRLYPRFAIADWLADHITESWAAKAPSLYGRFDLRYDGRTCSQCHWATAASISDVGVSALYSSSLGAVLPS
jgi:glutathionylspermidine synthase